LQQDVTGGRAVVPFTTDELGGRFYPTLQELDRVHVSERDLGARARLLPALSTSPRVLRLASPIPPRVCAPTPLMSTLLELRIWVGPETAVACPSNALCPGGRHLCAACGLFCIFRKQMPSCNRVLSPMRHLAASAGIPNAWLRPVEQRADKAAISAARAQIATTPLATEPAQPARKNASVGETYRGLLTTVGVILGVVLVIYLLLVILVQQVSVFIAAAVFSVTRI